MKKNVSNNNNNVCGFRVTSQIDGRNSTSATIAVEISHLARRHYFASVSRVHRQKLHGFHPRSSAVFGPDTTM